MVLPEITGCAVLIVPALIRTPPVFITVADAPGPKVTKPPLTVPLVVNTKVLVDVVAVAPAEGAPKVNVARLPE